MQLPSALLSPNATKNKKNQLWKKILIFVEMELFSSNVKKILIFSQKKAFPIFLQMKPCTFYPKLKKYHLLREKLLCFKKRKHWKTSYIFFKRNLFIYFRKLLKFQELTFHARKSKFFYTFPCKETKFSWLKYLL